MYERIVALQEVLREEKLESILVTDPANVFYLTGLWDQVGKGFWVFVCQNNFWVITSVFYKNIIEEKVSASHLIMCSAEASRSQKLLGLAGEINKIAFEKESLSYAEYEFFEKVLSSKELVPCAGLVEKIRKIKDQKEIQKIKKAVKITDQAFESALKIIKPGVSEIFIGRKIREIMEDMGAEGTAFDSIVASGKNGADIHHTCSQKKIKTGEMVIIDIGAKYKEYCADFTRTIFIGKATPKFKNIYQIVLEVQKNSISRCNAGSSIGGSFSAVVDDFKKYGESENFIHALGHGVGVEIHELPHIGRYDNQGSFEDGMVVAIEPGLYYKDFGGVRIEDLCLIAGKCKPMSKVSKELIEIL
ncbi:MAG: Xaa-Pro peptidase family protein [Candidatus Paceibacterota bacterium]|jgi:Xaa-Pro aminopeptidase